MHVLDANELFGITSYTYDKIMEVWWKYWPDAFAMYFKLLKQARMQETNQTLTLNKFLMNYFGWWDDRVTRTKKILKDLWLIDDVIVRDELWKIKWHYVRVNYLIDEQKVRNSCSTYNLSTTTENQAVESTMSGKIETNALSTKYINAWSNDLSKDKCDEVANKTQDKSVDDFTQYLASGVEDEMLSARDKEKGFSEVWNLIPTWRAWWNKNNWQKAFLKKLDEWFSVEDIKKCALLAKLELREKAQDYNYTMKKENRLTNLCKISDEEMELRIIWILKARYERYLKWTKFQHNSVAELCDMFWSDYVNWLRKDIQKEYKQHF